MLIILAGCTDPAYAPRLVDDVPMPTSDGGPFGGDGTAHVIAVVLAFEVKGEVHGDIGAHCGYDGWTPDPATARIHVGPDDHVPTRTLMRMLKPGQDTEGVTHFGTATYADWRGDWAIKAAFDHERTLGTVTWDPPRFNDHAIPQGQWTALQHVYATPDGVVVHETLYLRDFGEVPVALDRHEKLCF